MASSSSASSLAFGIEMEFLARPKAPLMPLLSSAGWNPKVTIASNDESLKNRNRVALRAAIAQVLSSRGILASSVVTDYYKWTVADERSLDEVTGFWRIELVSRVMRTADRWTDEIDLLYQTLYRYCDVILTKGCSMHVHVSPSATADNKYTRDQLIRIMKAMAYYDEPITKIMPASRKNNRWAMSNMQSGAAPKALRDAYSMVPTHTWRHLFSIFDEIKMAQQVYIKLGSQREMSWNFGNITDCGTVEFRRPPGVQSAAGAKHWAAFTLGFIFQALTTDPNMFQNTKSYPSVTQLKSFVHGGISKLERNSQGALNLHLIIEDHSTPTVYTAAELESIKRKKAEKNKMKSAFVQKANSRPNTPV